MFVCVQCTYNVQRTQRSPFMLILLRLFYFIYLFILNYFSCAGSSLLYPGFLELQRAGPGLQLGCACCSLHWLCLLWDMGFRQVGFSSCGANTLVYCATNGILPDQGSNLCSAHWPADLYPMGHHGSPLLLFLYKKSLFLIIFEMFSLISCTFGLLYHLRIHGQGCETTNVCLDSYASQIQGKD